MQKKITRCAARNALARSEEAPAGAGEAALKQEVEEGMEAVPTSGVTAFRRAIFLRELSRCLVVGKAARKAGIRLGSLYRLREKDERFALAWDEALVASVDAVEEILVETAMAGNVKAIEMVLKGNRSDKYRERVEHAVGVQGTFTVDLVPMDKPLSNEEDPGTE